MLMEACILKTSGQVGQWTSGPEFSIPLQKTKSLHSLLTLFHKFTRSLGKKADRLRDKKIDTGKDRKLSLRIF